MYEWKYSTPLDLIVGCELSQPNLTLIWIAYALFIGASASVKVKFYDEMQNSKGHL